jgi:hypothetical protein
MASRKYYFVGTHADTVYKGDYAIPVGHGMEPISLSDDDLKDERNAHLIENGSFQAVEDEKAEAEKTSKQVKEGEN